MAEQPQRLVPTFLIAFILPLSLILLLGIGRRLLGKKAHGAVPPSPFKLPIIGNVHQLGPLLHRSLHALAQGRGPFMLLHLGHAPTLVVSSPDAAREILRHHDRVFASRPQLTPVLHFNGGNDLGFSAYGERWRQLRRICTVHLLSSASVQSFRHMREEEVAVMLRKISALAAAPSPPPAGINMSEILYSLSNDMTCRVVSGKFGRKEERNALFRELIDQSIELLGKVYVGDLVPWLGWIDQFLGNVKKMKMNRKRWDDMLDEVIREHVDRSAQGVGPVGGDERKDFVDILLSLQQDPDNKNVLTPEIINSLIIDMFIGGTDTSFIVLEFAMAELIRHPIAMKKLQDEVRSCKSIRGGIVVKEEDVREMIYLKAVIREVLRLHPPLPCSLPHQAMEDCRVGEYEIAKNTQVFVNVWAIMRDPEHWEAPEEFKPERFSGDGAPDYLGNDFQYIPFGSGRRICPGMQFGLSTVEVGLANLVYHFDWELPVGSTREDLHAREAPGTIAQREGRLHLVPKPRSELENALF